MKQHSCIVCLKWNPVSRTTDLTENADLSPFKIKLQKVWTHYMCLDLVT